MLKEVLTLVLTALPNWLALVLMGLDWYERWKNKQSDGAGGNQKARRQPGLSVNTAPPVLRLATYELCQCSCIITRHFARINSLRGWCERQDGRYRVH